MPRTTLCGTSDSTRSTSLISASAAERAGGRSFRRAVHGTCRTQEPGAHPAHWLQHCLRKIAGLGAAYHRHRVRTSTTLSSRPTTTLSRAPIHLLLCMKKSWPGRTTRSIHAFSEEGIPKFHVGVAMTKRSDASSLYVTSSRESRRFLVLRRYRLESHIIQIGKMINDEIAVDDLRGCVFSSGAYAISVGVKFLHWGLILRSASMRRCSGRDRRHSTSSTTSRGGSCAGDVTLKCRVRSCICC